MKSFWGPRDYDPPDAKIGQATISLHRHLGYFCWRCGGQRRRGDTEDKGTAMAHVELHVPPPRFRTPALPCSLHYKKTKLLRYEYPLRMPMWCKVRASLSLMAEDASISSPASLDHIHFVGSSTFFRLLAGNGRDKEYVTLLQRHDASGAIIADTFQLSESRDVHQIGYEVERICTEDSNGGRWREQQNYNARVVTLGPFRLLVVAEVDALQVPDVDPALRGGAPGSCVEIKAGRRERNEVLLQCLLNGSSHYTQFSSRLAKDRRDYYALDLVEVTEESCLTCKPLQCDILRIVRWLQYLSEECEDLRPHPQGGNPLCVMMCNPSQGLVVSPLVTSPVHSSIRCKRLY